MRTIVIISLQVGAYGSSSDSNVFKNSIFGKLLESNKRNIPDPRVLHCDAEGLSMPFVLVGDEAFALSEHVLRTYPSKKLTFLKRIQLQVVKSTKDSRMHLRNFG